MYLPFALSVLAFVTVSTGDHAPDTLSSSLGAQSFHRTLIPVKYPSTGNQQRQANPFAWDHELDLEYVDMGTYNDPQTDTFGATVSIDTYNPAVQTEQFDGAVTSIQCSNNNSMNMDFANNELAELAKTTWDVPALTIITYTPSCNDDDERVPWEITKLQFSGSSASMNARRLTWNEAGTTRSVDFGSRSNITNPVSQGHNNVKRDIDIPLNWNIPAGVNLLKTGVADISVTEKCKACSITGKAVLRSGSFTTKNGGGSKKRRGARTLEERSWWSDFTDMFSFAHIELDFQGFGGSFLLETEADAEHDFDFHILGEDGVGIPGLQIKNILTIGPRVDPVITGTIGLKEPLQLDYGFKFGVPSGAGVTVDLLSPSSSDMHGFDGTSFNALPFTTNIKNVTNGAKVGIAFKPTFSFGIDLHGHKFDAVELEMEVPKYSVIGTGMRNVDKNCASGGNNNDAVKFEGSFEFDAAVKGGGNSSLKFNKQLFDKPGLAPASTCIVFGGSSKPKPSAGSSSKPAGSGSKPTGSASNRPSISSLSTAVGSGIPSAATSSLSVASNPISTPTTPTSVVSSFVPTFVTSATPASDGIEIASTSSDTLPPASLITALSTASQSDLSVDPSSATDSVTDTAESVETEPTQGTESTGTGNSGSQTTQDADPNLTQPSEPSQTSVSDPSVSRDSDTVPTPTEDLVSSPTTDADPTGTDEPDSSSETPADDSGSSATDSSDASPTSGIDSSSSEDTQASPSGTPDPSSSDEPDTSSEGNDDNSDSVNGDSSSDGTDTDGDSNDPIGDAASGDDQAPDSSTDNGSDTDQTADDADAGSDTSDDADDTDSDSGTSDDTNSSDGTATPDQSADTSVDDDPSEDDTSTSPGQDATTEDSSTTSNDDGDASTDDQDNSTDGDSSTDDDSSEASDDSSDNDTAQDGSDTGEDDGSDSASDGSNASDDQVPAKI